MNNLFPSHHLKRDAFFLFFLSNSEMNFLKGFTGGDGGKEGGGTGGGWLESLKEKSKELAEVYKRDIGMASASEFSLHLRQHFQHLRQHLFCAFSVLMPPPLPCTVLLCHLQ
jgi:hypothetical protein